MPSFWQGLCQMELRSSACARNTYHCPISPAQNVYYFCSSQCVSPQDSIVSNQHRRHTLCRLPLDHFTTLQTWLYIVSSFDPSHCNLPKQRSLEPEAGHELWQFLWSSSLWRVPFHLNMDPHWKVCGRIWTLWSGLWVEEGRKFYSSTRTYVRGQGISTTFELMHSDLHHPLVALLNLYCLFLSLTANNLGT